MTHEEIGRLTRPHPDLWKLYLMRSILSGPLIILTLPLYFFRYRTLRYHFDDEGIHAQWGILFRQEINLNYARIQDIHLTSGFLQRWLGLADIQVQTASGSATPELVIEGFKEYEAIRNYLYTKMRGYRQSSRPSSAATLAAPQKSDDLAAALQEVAGQLSATREAIERLESRSRPASPDSRAV